MSLSKTPTGEMLYKSALIGAGLLGMFLWRKEVLPKYMGIISIGATSFGLCSYVWHILKGDKKRSYIDFCPENTYYDEIASQVNKELSQEGSQSGVIKRLTVGETEKFDPVAYLKRGMKISEVQKRKEPSCHGSFLKTCADRFRSRESPKRETEIEKITSEDPLELPLSEDEDEPSVNEIEVKKNITLNLSKTKLSLLRDGISKSKGQSSQSVPGFFKEFESICSEAEKEISGIKWSKRGRSKKVFGVGKSKAPKK